MNAGGKLVVEAVSFDVTGTLIHCPRLAELYSEVLARHGAELSAERLKVLIPEVWQELTWRLEGDLDRFGAHPQGARGWWNDYLQRICDHAELPHPGPFASAELFDRFAQADAWEIYDDVEPALEALRAAGYRLVMTSNWDERLPTLLDRLGLMSPFEALIYSSEVGFEKPHRAIFDELLRSLDLRAQQVVHVGDRQLDDVEGAEAVGIPALLLDRRGGEGDLSDLRRLPERLERGGAVLS